MRALTLSRLSDRDVRAARVAVAAGALAGLAALGACADNGGKSITAPSGPRTATIGSGNLDQAKTLTLCVSAGSPAGTYTFRNIALNRSWALDGIYPFTLDGNGTWGGSLTPPDPTHWYDRGTGGTGTTVAPFGVNVDYPVTPGPGNCVLVLNRTVPNSDFATTGFDTFAAANISYQSNTAGAVYDHTDCLLDNGVLMPQHVNPTTGTNPPVPTVPWPAGGYNSADPAFAAYGCGTNNAITRAFVNFEHGATITYAFVPAPPQEVVPLFVIGDLVQWTLQPNAAPINGNKPVPPNTVNFWGSQWWKNNPMSQFHSNGWPSFKGYASSVNLTPTNGAPCGTWTSRVGNSPPPPQTIPEFVGIIITNNVIKVGPDLTGGIQEIVVVHSDGGYGPNPGHDGNGPVVRIVCGGAS